MGQKMNWCEPSKNVGGLIVYSADLLGALPLAPPPVGLTSEPDQQPQALLNADNTCSVQVLEKSWREGDQKANPLPRTTYFGFGF